MIRFLPALLVLFFASSMPAHARAAIIHGSTAPGRAIEASGQAPAASAYRSFDTAELINLQRHKHGAWVRLEPAASGWPSGPLVLTVHGAMNMTSLEQAADMPQSVSLFGLQPTVLNHRHGLSLLLPQSLRPHQPLLLYFSKAWYQAPVGFSVRTLAAHLQSSGRWLAFASACFACMALLSFLALFIAAAMRDMTYVYYAAFTLGFVAIQALKTGYVLQPLQLDILASAPRATLLLGAGWSALFTALFLARFTDMRRLAPRLQTVTCGLGAVCALGLALAALPLGVLADWSRSVLDPFLAIMASAYALLIVIMLARGSRYAAVLLASWLPLFALVLCAVLQRHGYLLGWTWLGNAVLAATALQAVVLSLGFFDRIRSMRSQRDQARVEAETDPLTGAISRGGWSSRTEALIAAAHANGTPLSVLFIDLDHFKALNDRYGHPLGDAALMALVTCLRTQLRADDLLGRYGGEEFVVALPGCDSDRARRMGERLRRSIERLRWRPAAGAAAITISIGCADLRAGENTLSLIERADRAMYEAKSAGRNRVVHALSIVAVGHGAA